MTRYLLCWPLWLLVILARYPAASIAVLCFSSSDKRSLTRWHWLETIDCDLCGDSGWRAKHMLGSDPYAWYNRIGWLWRNGGNRFNYYVIGIDAVDPPKGIFWRLYHVPLRGQWFLDLRFGWDITNSKQGRSKYVFTTRLKSKP